MDDSRDQPGTSASSLAELDALLDDPARWAEVDPDKLRHLLFYRCLSYGLQPDESVIPSLMDLHRVAVERLHPAVRRQVVVHLARAVERVHREHEVRDGAGCTNALLPFLLGDPDPSVVSSAALEMALLLPLEGGDALTGPRYVRGLSDQLEGDDAKAGLVAGLLQLGDARVAALLHEAWRELGVEGRQTLALLVQSLHGLNGLTVQFLVSWLEDEVRDPGSASFGMVTATLARAGRHAAEHGVVEFDRILPVSEAPENMPAGAIRHLTLDECLGSISSRLVGAGWAETPPRLMPHVLSYWGLGEEGYRLAAAAGVAEFLAPSEPPGDGGHHPVRLELAPDWPEPLEQETLLEWGIFNPLGPTVNTLRLTPTPKGAALVYTIYHPAGSVSRVMTTVAGASDAAALGQIVARVMAANGDNGVWLVRSLPDYVHVPAASPLDRRHIAAGLAAARDAAERAGQETVELDWHARRLRRLAHDPWVTANGEIEQASAGAAADASLSRPASRVRASGPPPPDVDEYVGWLDVAAAPAHVASIRSQIPVAWQRVVVTADHGEGG